MIDKQLINNSIVSAMTTIKTLTRTEHCVLTRSNRLLLKETKLSNVLYQHILIIFVKHGYTINDSITLEQLKEWLFNLSNDSINYANINCITRNISIVGTLSNKEIKQICNIMPTHVEQFKLENNLTRIYFFAIVEYVIPPIVIGLLGKNIYVEDTLLEMYFQVNDCLTQSEKYLCGIKDNKLHNIPKELNEIIVNEIGEINESTYLKYVDRKFRYGFNLVPKLKGTSLVEKIANRDSVAMYHPLDCNNITNLLDALMLLDRTPILVATRSSSGSAITNIAKYLEPKIPLEQQCCLIDSTNSSNQQIIYSNTQLANEIKELKLSKLIKADTKIVYVSAVQLPNILLKISWKPSTALIVDAPLFSKIIAYITMHCDLIIHESLYLNTIYGINNGTLQTNY